MQNTTQLFFNPQYIETKQKICDPTFLIKYHKFKSFDLLSLLKSATPTYWLMSSMSRLKLQKKCKSKVCFVSKILVIMTNHHSTLLLSHVPLCSPSLTSYHPPKNLKHNLSFKKMLFLQSCIPSLSIQHAHHQDHTFRY